MSTKSKIRKAIRTIFAILCLLTPVFAFAIAGWAGILQWLKMLGFIVLMLSAMLGFVSFIEFMSEEDD